MIIAGDVGGTSTRLGLFDPIFVRPRAVALRVFATRDFADLAAMIATFIADPAVAGASIDTGSFGVAGPMVGEMAQLTNVSWQIDLAASLSQSRQISIS